jgi:two-component system CheB/CheR fusion protein
MPRNDKNAERNSKGKDRQKEPVKTVKHPEHRQAQQEEEKIGREDRKDDLPNMPAAETGDIEVTEEDDPSGNGRKEERVPVVGIGASAGGLQALEAFFSTVPEESGITYVVITHTDPDRTSLLPDILKRKSKIEVRRIEEGMQAAPDAVYLPPSDKELVIEGRVFHLKEREIRGGLHMPIDVFLRSLAEDSAERAGCVILSGTGTDGTHGLRAIKERAGVALAQSTDSARHAGMPRSAIETGLVDFILAPEKMAAELIRYFRHPAAIEAKKEKALPDALRQILSFLANRTNHDFSLYKKSTLIRRIERRMSVTRSQNGSEYLGRLHRSEKEVEALFQDLLIGVTNFFRNPEAFAFLKTDILPDLIDRAEDTLRIWVAGCSTGEEAYSVAISVKESLMEKNRSLRLQIFATDLDRQAIEKARHGAYIENIAADVSADRLERFFNKTDHFYQVNKDIRETIVFALQNVLNDPPFSNLDLLVCRNLLIYLEPEAQRKLIPLFHYTLKPGGVLFLGSSESVGRFGELFQTVNKKFCFYRKKETKNGLMVEFPTKGGSLSRVRQELEERKPDRNAGPTMAQATERLLLADFTPPCAIVDTDGQILHIHGRTGKYLEQPPGRPSLNVIEMAREGIRFALSSAIREAKSLAKEVRKERLRVHANGGYQEIDLTVKPLSDPPSLKDTLMVVFQDIQSVPEKESKNRDEGDPRNRGVLELERDLSRVRQQYQGSVEELESSNEELRSVNEEVQSSNEELQSSNEELESSKEELQSLNEELSTVNSELQNKIEELAEAYDSISRVLNSTQIAVLFLDNDLAVKRFTEEAARLINLIDSDVGRPIEHISHNLKYEKLIEKVRGVLDTLSPFEDDVESKDGRWYRMRVMVFRTREGVIDGAVITLIDIDAQKKAQADIEEFNAKALQSERRFAESIVDTVRESLLVLDEGFRVVTANRRFYETFATAPENTEGHPLFELGEGQWDIETLRSLLSELIQKEKSFDDYFIEHRFKALGKKRILLNARLLREDEKEKTKILLAIQDVTQQEQFKAQGMEKR